MYMHSILSQDCRPVQSRMKSRFITSPPSAPLDPALQLGQTGLEGTNVSTYPESRMIATNVENLPSEKRGYVRDRTKRNSPTAMPKGNGR